MIIQLSMPTSQYTICHQVKLLILMNTTQLYLIKFHYYYKGYNHQFIFRFLIGFGLPLQNINSPGVLMKNIGVGFYDRKPFLASGQTIESA